MRKVKKRNGKIVDYNSEKIFNAIKNANRDSKDRRMNTKDIKRLVRQVEENLKKINIPNVEKIQNTVEMVLMNSGWQVTAKSYIIYRAEHAKARDAASDLMDSLRNLTFKSAKEMESRRDNANINTDTAMGTMLKYGTETSNYFNDNFIIPKKFVDAHRDGLIHIHDKDFLTITYNCCQIDIIKLFKGGFNTGHGQLREPNSVRAAGNLACIAIQSNQNEMYGGSPKRLAS